MNILGIDYSTLMTKTLILSFFRIFVLVFIAFPIIFWFSKWIRNRVTNRYSAQHGMIIGKIVLYGGLIYIVISFLKEFNFSLTPLLGAAGIVGIALGFASQTSVSNIISGLFLVAEKPFVVGDLIQVGSTIGQVLSIDTLSIKLRMFDNKFVRIPNETIIKSEVINITRFPIRRVDLNVGVAYKENLGRVREVLLDIAFKHPLCLQEPEPLVIFTGYGNSSIDMLFVAWTQKNDWLTVKNDLMETIKNRFDEDGIEIPFPHLSLYKGLATEPFPVTIVTNTEKSIEKNTDII